MKATIDLFERVSKLEGKIDVMLALKVIDYVALAGLYWIIAGIKM